MTFIIRPNNENPDWPIKPDPVDLEQAMEAARKAQDPVKAMKEAPAKALARTQARVAKGRRMGAHTDNLDWLDMVRTLRTTIRNCEPRADGQPGEDRTFCWIVGVYPDKAHVLTLETSTRFQEWSTGSCGNRYRYCYVTFEVQS